MEQEKQEKTPLTEFGWIDTLSQLLDNRFQLPFLGTRFGADAIIGLIPGVGDWISLGISTLIIGALIRRGVSVGMLLRMIGNLIGDAMIGVVPVLGDLLDFRVKANKRNIALLKQYYVENPTPPSAKRSVLIVGLGLLAIAIVFIALFLKVVTLVLTQLWQLF
jgi:hypothetical protein